MENINSNIRELLPEGAKELILEMPAEGIFLTGIENSDPWVNGVRRDQFKEAYDFYTNYEERLRNIKSLGIKWLRFGPSYSQTHLGNDKYDFSFCDKIINLCKKLKINILADLLHFGLPRWLDEENSENSFFQNSIFPEYFAKYAVEFCIRYPDIRYFTLVNEPYITAFFSAKIGIWSEEKISEWKDDKDFINAVKNISKAVVLAQQAIEKIWKDENRKGYPIFLQNESFELATNAHESRQEEVERFNIRRFAALDLIFAKKDPKMKEYLISQGLKEEDYNWFMDNGSRKNVILGIDHYPACVKIYNENDIINCDPLHPYQLYSLVVEYWDRYKLPLLHTETNGWPNFAVKLCQETYEVISQLRIEGYPVSGMGWYGDEYQVGWHHALIGPNSFEESHVGLFYKGKLQPVGQLFGELVKKGFPPIILKE